MSFRQCLQGQGQEVAQLLSHADSLRPHGLQHARLLHPPLSPRVWSSSWPLSQWCYLTISSSVTIFSFCLQSFPASVSFSSKSAFCIRWPSIGASSSASVLPMNIQGWFLLGLTGLISLQSKGLSRVFSSTTNRKHQFSNAQPSLRSNSILNWRIIALQCCIGFCHTTTWISYKYTYVPFFLSLPSTPDSAPNTS